MMMVSRSQMAMDSSTVLVGDWILGLHSKVFLLQWKKDDNNFITSMKT
jgi:hypothetical protein